MSALRERLIELLRAIKDEDLFRRVDGRLRDDLKDLLWRLEKGDPV